MDVEIIPLDHEVDVDNFNCENGSLNIKLRNAYYLQIIKLASVKEIITDSVCVGYYIISISSVDSDNLTYSAIKLDILCIDTRYQGQNIGTEILKYIISEAIEFSNFAGCRYLILDAVREKYQWYFERGFTPFPNVYVDINSPIIPMHIDFQDNNLVKEYADE